MIFTCTRSSHGCIEPRAERRAADAIPLIVALAGFQMPSPWIERANLFGVIRMVEQLEALKGAVRLAASAVAIGLAVSCGGAEHDGGTGPTSIPTIALATTTQLFSANVGSGSPAPQSITITNGGSGTLGGFASWPGGLRLRPIDRLARHEPERHVRSSNAHPHRHSRESGGRHVFGDRADYVVGARRHEQSAVPRGDVHRHARRRGTHTERGWTVGGVSRTRQPSARRSPCNRDRST